MVARITGVEEAISNLHKEVAQIQNVTMKGLLRGATIIRRDAQEMCPVVTGNLKSSAYINPSEGGDSVEVGFTANYAAKVHENPNAGKGDRKGEPKFLEKAIRNNEAEIVKIIAREAGDQI